MLCPPTACAPRGTCPTRTRTAGSTRPLQRSLLPGGQKLAESVTARQSLRLDVPAKGACARSTRDAARVAHTTRARGITKGPSPASGVSALCGAKVEYSDTERPVFRDGCIEEDTGVTVRDDLDSLLKVLPCDVRQRLEGSSRRGSLLEIVLDLGRRPEARFLDAPGGEELREAEVTYEELDAAAAKLGEFGGDNRAGLPGTLHRISCIRNRRGKIIGLTCRVGRAVTGHADMIRDLLDSPDSLLLLGRPGVGKTTVIRELARILADDFHKRVVIIDTSSEIGGDGDVPHPAIGGARRMQVADPSQQHHLMIEAVENHMPEVVIVDEVSTEAEALACRTIAERGVQLVATAHGQVLANLLKNPTLSDLVGGIQSVTLGDDEARSRGTQKTILERKGPPTFPTVIEMRERGLWVAHDTQTSVDDLLLGRMPLVEVRSRDADHKVVVSARPYDVDNQVGAGPRRSSVPGDEDSLAWTLRMGAVPDKDALINAAMGLYAGAPPAPGGGKRGSNSPRMRAVASKQAGGRSAR